MKDTYFNAESVNQTFEDIGRMGGEKWIMYESQF